MTEFGEFNVELGHLTDPLQLERLRNPLNHIVLVDSELATRAQEAIASMTEQFAGLARSIEDLMSRWNAQTATWNAQINAACESIATWREQTLGLLAPLPRLADDLQAMLEPFLEEERVAQVILATGLLPHTELIELFKNGKLPEGEVSEVAERIARQIWPKLRTQLQLSQDDCLGDQKLFRSFNEMLSAHDLGLYEITTLSGAFVIERAIRLAQRHRARPDKPHKWLDSELLEMSCDQIRNWRLVSVLLEQTFAQCWTDLEVETIRHLNRHAVAHGRDAKVSNVVESLNIVMLAHFAITAAFAFENQMSNRH